MSEAFTLVKYDAPLVPPGAVCEACGTTGKTGRLARDHCHEHGWIRGIVCLSCNCYMERIDQRFAPKVAPVLLSALLALWHRCPDCGQLDVSGLEISAPKPKPKPERCCADNGGTEPLRCAGIAGVAVWLSMTPQALAKAMERHPGWPQEDASIGQQRPGHDYLGWLPARRPEWESWKASLPGQGKGGGRPRKERA